MCMSMPRYDCSAGLSHTGMAAELLTSLLSDTVRSETREPRKRDRECVWMCRARGRVPELARTRGR